MTKEQAIKIIRRYECNSEHYEACEIAIKALEQSSYNSIKTELKPCEDAISRRAVIDGINRYFHDEYYQRTSIQDCRDCLIEDVINKLPAVNPQPSGDLISRQSAIFLASDLKQDLPDDERIADMVMAHNEGVLEYQTQLSLLPSVNPQPKTGHCKDCKYFEYDSVAKVDGIPLIVAHEICKRWGDGCKTKEDGYCFLYEPQERSDKE